MAPDPLVRGQAFGRATGDPERRSKHGRRRRYCLENRSTKAHGCPVVATAELSNSSATAHLYPQEKRQTPTVRHPRHVLSGYAGSTSASARTHSGNPSGPELIWVSTQAFDC